MINKNWHKKGIIMVIFMIIPFESLCQNSIIVCKEFCKLAVVNHSGDTLCTMQCGVGLKNGPKIEKGDMKTPEGTFTIVSIENSSKWTHDFNDGFGKRKGAYGPWFIRLDTEFIGIGIHGTCFPESIGTRCSEGCIRLRNEDVTKLIKFVSRGDKVIIRPDTRNIACLSKRKGAN